MYIASKKEEINTLVPQNTKLHLLLAEVGRTRLVILSKERFTKGLGKNLFWVVLVTEARRGCHSLGSRVLCW